MGIANRLLSGLFSLTGNGSQFAAPEFWATNISAYNFSGYGLNEFVHNAYCNPFVFMCVDKIADVGSQLPYKFINEATLEEMNPAIVSEASRLLDKPNQSQTADDFYYEVISELLVTGNCFICGSRPVGFSRFGELKVLKSQDVTINAVGGTQSGIIKNYTAVTDTKILTIQPEDMLHIKFPNIVEETHWGLSPLYAAISVYESSNNIFEAEAHLHKNRGISGVLSNKDSNMPMLPKEQERLQQDWHRKAAGASNFGKMLITNASLEWLQVGMSPTDLMSLEGNLAKQRIICSIFGLDSSLFNDPANKTYNNRADAEKSMYTSVVLPLLDKINRSLSMWLLRKNFSIPDALIKADFSNVSVLNAPNLELSKKVLEEVKVGILSAEEARAILYPEMK